MNENFWKAALVRAVRTVAQVLAASIPADLAITAAMIRSADWNVVGLSVLAWLATGLLSGVASLLTSIKTGLPETDARIEYRYMDENGVPVDGHYMLCHNNIDVNIAEEDCEACEECDISAYLDGDGEDK